MSQSRKKFIVALLAGTAGLALAAGAQAAPKSDAQAAADAKIQALQDQIQDLSVQVQDLKRSTSDQYTDVQNQQTAAQSSAVKVSIANGRPTFSSADGKFTLAIRALAQADWGYYSQSAAAAALPAAYGPDLGSGANFRRVYLGLQGKVFGDWSYNFNYDFGGSGGTETPGHIQSVYLEYDGLAPFALRVGAFPPPASIEDGTSAGDTIFLERNAPSDLQRNIAGGDGRDAVSLLYTGDTVFGALSYTGNKIQDGAKALAAAGATAAPNFDEQQALLGRLSWLPVSTSDAHLLIGVNGTYVIKPPDSLANNVALLGQANGTARATTTLSDPPELTVDSNGILLASTTGLSARHVSQWGVETAGNWENLYGQAGYYGFEVERAPVSYLVPLSAGAAPTAATPVTPSNDHFSGWYLQGTWILTGESKTYNPATGSFTPPKPAHPFALDGSGWGAFELAGRYSDLDLNDHVLDTTSVLTAWASSGATPKTYTFYNTVRGGEQKIWTAGLNWYPNSVVRFALNYEFIQIDRLQSGSSPNAATGLTANAATAGTPVLPALSASQDIQTIAIRAQISL
jgi:phosphate-selective porin OprO/OprP